MPRLKNLWQEYWGIILITVLAAAFRFVFFDLEPYGFDQAYPTFQALQILDEGELPTTSLPNPLGLPNPPFMSYIATIPLFLSRSPLTVQGFITLLNIAAISLTYLMALRLFDKKTALAASFFYATSPWAVALGRIPWVQGLLPFFTALVTYFLFLALAEKANQDRMILSGLLAAALMAQTYFLAYAVVAQLALLFLAFRRNLNWRPVLAGSMLFLLVSFPYILSALSQTSQSPRGLQEFLAGPWMVDGQALIHALNLASTGTSTDYFNGAPLVILPWGDALAYAARIALALFVILGISEGVLQWLRKRHAASYLPLLVWFLAPIVLMTIHSIPVQPHYLMLTYPAVFVLAGIGFRRLWQPNSEIPAAILALGLFIIYSFGIGGRYQYLTNNPNASEFDLLPMRHTLRLGEVVREIAGEVYVQEPQLWISAVSGTIVSSYQEFDPERFIVLRPNQTALYILLDPKELSPVFSFAEELAEKRIDLPNNGNIRFYLFPARSREEVALLPSHRMDLRFDIGWRLLGYDRSLSAPPGKTITFTTYWLMEELPPDHATLYFKPFVHLLDENGQRVAQEDGRGQAGYLWRDGDLFIDTSRLLLPLDLSPGNYWIYTGLYDPNTSPCCRRALLPNGEDHVLLGPLRIE